MKLRKIRFDNHEILNNLEVNFCDNNGVPLNTVVIIGNNGTGKTTLLKSLFDSFEVDDKGYNIKSMLDIELHSGDFYTSVQLAAGEVGMLDPDIIGDNISKDDPKVVYMPAEINFDKLKKVDNTFKFSPNFLNIVDQSITENIPSFIATKINKYLKIEIKLLVK